MNKYQIRALHAPLAMSIARGLQGLGAAIPISLTVNTPYQQVGKPGTFKIIGAPPNATIYWSSYKDGKETGELNASYGQTTEANGTAELEFTPAEADAGNWVKEILVKDASDRNYTAMVQYVVLPAAAATTGGSSGTTTSGGGDILDTLKNGGFYLGQTFIPYYIPVIGAAAWFFFKKK